MHRSGKGVGASFLLLVLLLAHHGARAHAATPPFAGGPPQTAGFGREPLLAGPPQAAGAVTEPTPTRPAIGYSYVVQPGDTLWDIAAAHRLTLDELLAANDMAGKKFLQPGQALFVPAQPAPVVHKLPTATPVKPVEQPAGDPAAAPSARPTPGPTAAPPAAPAPGATAAPPAQPAPAPTDAPLVQLSHLPPQSVDWPAALIGLINEQRTAAGLPALTLSAELSAAAQAHAEDCARRDWGSHVGSDNAALRARLARAGYASRTASENWANTQSVQQTFRMWWNEPPGNDPHRRNILGRQYREIGLGIATGRWGYYFVADFGSR